MCIPFDQGSSLRREFPERFNVSKRNGPFAVNRKAIVVKRYFLFVGMKIHILPGKEQGWKIEIFLGSVEGLTRGTSYLVIVSCGS